jgi:micrococcal nuclease
MNESNVLRDPEINTFYKYKAKVISVYDGDTIRADIDLGFGVWLHNQKIRLLGIDTPEIRSEEREEGLKVKKIVEDMILNKDVMLISHKDKQGKYGRWLAEIIINCANLNFWLLENNYAKKYN